MSRDRTIQALRVASPAILPSLLLCDFGHLEREIRGLEDAGSTVLHLDVMDGVFVPNFTYGMTIVEAVRKITKLPLDAHLMMVEPHKYVTAFRDAGADSMTIHAEAVANPAEVLAQIKAADVVAGLAVNPLTPLDNLAAAIQECDLLLVMSVQAGFGGQSFNPIALDKLRQARELAGDRLLLEIDGGVSEHTISRCAEAGAQLFVVGSAIFRTPDYGAAIRRLAELAHIRAEVV